jgi:membrane protease subunit HflC
VLVQDYVTWQVPADAESVRHVLRSLRNRREAAWQIRPFFGAALHITTSSFGLADLLDTDPARIRTGEFEAKLGEQIHSHGQTGR